MEISPINLGIVITLLLFQLYCISVDCLLDNQPGGNRAQFSLKLRGNETDHRVMQFHLKETNGPALTGRQAPSVELYPDQQIVTHEGGDGLVQCRITDGIPTPELIWTRIDGKAFSPNVEELQVGILRFKQVGGSEAGQYLCHAENDAGSASAIATLIIQPLPQITLKYPGSESDGGRRQYHVKSGQRVRMECSADGNPAPSVSWSRHHPCYTRYGASGAETKESAVYEITRVSPSDAGTYKCEARNSVGTTQERVQLLVDSDDNENTVNDRQPVRRYPQHTRVKLSNEKYTVLEGGSVIMGCSVEDNRETIFLTWIRGNQLSMPAEHRIQNGTLFINNVRPDAAGEYICQGIGQSGNTLFTASSHLEVIAPPRIKLSPARQVVRPGNNAYISCTATGDQPISLSWVRQDGIMPRSVVVSGGILQFHVIELSDAGQYRCTARNPAGEAEAVADVIIDKQQQFIRAEQRNVSTYVGSSVELHCSAQPGSRVHWTRDGIRPMPLNARERDDGGHNILKLRKVSAEDGGRYLCHSESAHGSASDYVDLRIDRCISRLGFGNKEHELVRVATPSEGVRSCDTCDTEHGLHCRNNGICKEASTASGFVCICPSGFSGDHCERVVEACFPGSCNSGRCVNNEGGFLCLCPIGRKGTRCEEELIVGKLAFTADGGYVAYPTPKALKRMKITLRFKPNEVKDGILLYCAQAEDGKGDFASLTIHDRHIEFRFDVGSGTAIIRSRKELSAGEWATVVARRDGREGLLTVDGEEMVSGKSPGATRGLNLRTPLYVGGYNQLKIKLAPTVGLLEDSKGDVATFDGCIAGVEASSLDLDLVHSIVDSANVRECMEGSGVTDYHDLGGGIGDVDEVSRHELSDIAMEQWLNMNATVTFHS